LAARSAPDGQTLLVAAAALAANRSVFRNLPYDIERDFDPVLIVIRVANVLSVHPSVPARDLAEFVAYAKRSPVAYGSAGIGTLPHLAMELLKQRAGFDATHVPYRGSAPAITDQIAGRVQASFENLPPQLQFLRAGTLRGLAIGSRDRHPDVPELPPVAETPGFEGFEANAWQSVLAPAGTPRPILEHIAGILSAALATPQGEAQLRGFGAQPSGIALDQFRTLLRHEVQTWAEVVRRGNITAE
jgi:tripartite-type tricarboxylate transporter receptor subunit TctC